LEDDPDLDITFNGPRGSDIAYTLLSVVPEGHFTDQGHTKLARWREIIVDKHPDSKILTYSTWGSYMFPVWEHWLTKWDVPYVIFDGTGKQKQAALDRFRNDPDIRVFCSGDAGADSIDIPQANVVVNYNFPWKWTTDQQRTGRADRVDSTFDRIYKYSLIMPNSVDERRKAVCERKRSYHEAIFDGRAFDEAFSATMTREDLLYMLLGDSISST
jgi:SNF2 family DNA or RNA helicase